MWYVVSPICAWTSKRLILDHQVLCQKAGFPPILFKLMNIHARNANFSSQCDSPGDVLDRAVLPLLLIILIISLLLIMIINIEFLQHVFLFLCQNSHVHRCMELHLVFSSIPLIMFVISIPHWFCYHSSVVQLAVCCGGWHVQPFFYYSELFNCPGFLCFYEV